MKLASSPFTDFSKLGHFVRFEPDKLFAKVYVFCSNKLRRFVKVNGLLKFGSFLSRNLGRSGCFFSFVAGKFRWLSERDKTH